MPEQATEVQRINWSSCFAFTHLFRTFKMALHPGALALALIAILAIGLLGTVLDGVWSARNDLPVAGEIEVFGSGTDLGVWRKSFLDTRLASVRAAFPADVALPKDCPEKIEKLDTADSGLKQALKTLETEGYNRIKGVKDKPAEAAAIAANFNQAYQAVEGLRQQGIFETLWDYETTQIRQFVGAAAQLNITGGLDDEFAAAGTPGAVRRMTNANVGAIASLARMAQGFCWLFNTHPVYAVIFGLGKLAIFALFGGAICRMAAMKFARDERISLKSALLFSRQKFIGFVTAPLLPLGIIVALGVALAVGGLVGAIPWIGGTIAGLFLFLALAAGFIITLVTVGVLGGGSLMWPTIAVEGSDSFDAMSRSYSYIYSRPWKAALYALVASVYGAICYLFVRGFVWALLLLTRYFVGVGMKGTSRPGTGAVDGTKIDSLWPLPRFDELVTPALPFAGAYGDRVGQWFVHLWVGLAALLVGAFLIAFYLCATTIIYYLLRREVDATDLEDVYSEDADEEPGEPLPATVESAATSATVTIAAAEPETPPSSESGTPSQE